MAKEWQGFCASSSGSSDYVEGDMMDIQKEKRNYLAMLVAEDAITQEQCNNLSLHTGGNYFYSYSLASSTIDCINWGWQGWLKAQTVPDGFVLVPVKEIKTWYLDESEGMYLEDPDWLCDIPIGEVVGVERRISYELDQNPVYAAIQWDEINGDVGYYETFESKEEADRVAAHCKVMVEAQEQSHD